MPIHFDVKMIHCDVKMDWHPANSMLTKINDLAIQMQWAEIQGDVLGGRFCVGSGAGA